LYLFSFSLFFKIESNIKVCLLSFAFSQQQQQQQQRIKAIRKNKMVKLTE
jgi:hypothetical protein